MTSFLFTLCPYVLCFSAGGLICGGIGYHAGRWDEAYYWMFVRNKPQDHARKETYL